MQNVVEVSSPGEAKDNDDVVVDGTEGGIVLLEANEHRKSALITNVGANTIRVTTDGSDPAPTRGKRLLGGASLSLSSPFCPTKEVKACAEGANSLANASEVN